MELKGYSLDFIGQKRLSDSPYFQWVWNGIALCDGIHTMAADGTLDFAIIKRDGSSQFLLSGPTTKAQTIPYKAGDEITGIRLRQGIHLAHLPSAKILDVNMFLPNASEHAFWFQNTAFSFPRFDTIEVFIDKLIKLGIIRRDIVIEDAIAGRAHRVHLRTVQRHFIAITGLTPYRIFQIQRAEKAQKLLQNGASIPQVVHDVGFSDQSHMTNSLKYLIGHTPGKLRQLAEDW